MRSEVPTDQDMTVNPYFAGFSQETRDFIADRFQVKDSGARQEGPGGMLKEAMDKPCPTLIPTWFLWRLAAHMTKGAKKYKRNNWRLAETREEFEGFQDSAFRHFLQWLDGEQDEDHAAALVANVFMAENVKNKLNDNKEL